MRSLTSVERTGRITDGVTENSRTGEDERERERERKRKKRLREREKKKGGRLIAVIYIRG